MYLSLIRDTATGSYCLGTFQAGALQFQSLELPWIPDPIGKGGKHGVSCVPPGLYQLVRHDSPKHPRSFAMVNPALDVYHLPDDVPPEKRAFARTTVLLHAANWPAELEGCCALGMHRTIGGVSESREALAKFNTVVPWIPGHAVGIEFGSGVEVSSD
jgi:hypothetical protein